MSYCLQAQAPTAFFKDVLPALEARWEQPGGDTAIHFVLERAHRFCGEDDNCLSQVYKVIMSKLERRSNLPSAIFVGEELIKVAQRQGDLHAEADAFIDLHRFHNALRNDRVAIVNLEKALPLLEQVGDSSTVAYARMSLLEYSLHYRKMEEVLPEMEALLVRANKNKDTTTVNYLHIRLLQYTQEAGLYDKMEEHVVALEKTLLSDPAKPVNYGVAIHAALGRADLFRIQKNWIEAERYYQKTLRLCEAEPSRWMEVNVLQTLSDMEWERGEAALSKSYLDQAQGKAEKLGFDELLEAGHNRKAKIAEAEGRFADALKSLKKEQFYKDKLKAANAGFNMESYYLQREKEQLATEKKNQELELKLRKTQLRTTLVIAVLILLIAALSLAGFRRQRNDKRELEAQNTLIQDQAEKLKSLDVAKSRFFANVSHELRTPLTLILGPIKSALKSGTLDHRNAALLKMARQSGDDLLKLVGSLLDLSKLEHGKMTLKESPELVSQLLRRIVSSFESHAEYLGIQLTFFYQEEKDLQLVLDREKVEVVLNNLLSNAIKFTGKGGDIEVSVEDKDHTLLISVKDTGRGISPADLPHVFDRFYQSREKNALTEGGTGIGLALCRELVNLMGGKIWAESKSGGGSTFFVELPKKEVLRTPVIQEATPDDTRDIAQETVFTVPVVSSVPAVPGNLPNHQADRETTILVVEDNYSLRDYLNTILSPYYQVVSAKNGQEALEWLREEEPESRRRIFPQAPYLILSDLMMPVMDGYRLLEELKGNDATRHIPVIMLTARADARDKLKALRIGVDDYLTKPFDEEELLVRIQNLLQNRAARQDATAGTDAGIVPSPITLSSNDAVWLENFEAFVRKNLGKDILVVPMLAHEFAMSESSLLRQLKRLTGLPTAQYLLEIRLDEARRLLETRTCNSIAQVASRVGYGEVRSFSRVFKQRFGRSPSDFSSA